MILEAKPSRGLSSREKCRCRVGEGVRSGDGKQDCRLFTMSLFRMRPREHKKICWFFVSLVGWLARPWETGMPERKRPWLAGSSIERTVDTGLETTVFIISPRGYFDVKHAACI